MEPKVKNYQPDIFIREEDTIFIAQAKGSNTYHKPQSIFYEIDMARNEWFRRKKTAPHLIHSVKFEGSYPNYMRIVIESASPAIFRKRMRDHLFKGREHGKAYLLPIYH